MVSLSGYDNFSGNLSDQLLAPDGAPTCGPALMVTLEPPSNKVQTSAVIVFQAFLMLDLAVIAYILPYLPPLGLQVFSIIVYMHCCIWGVSLVCDSYLRSKHTILNCQGFIDFYQRTKNLRRTSLNVMSAGTLMMLLISVLVSDYCPDRENCPPGFSSHIYLQLIITIETVLIIPVLVFYLKLNNEFHRMKVLPEIQPEDFITSILQTQSTTEIGHRDNGPVEDIVEKQSDMIRYLKTYNTYLTKKVLKLSEQLEQARTHNLTNV